MSSETTIGIRLPSKKGDVYRLLYDVCDITRHWFEVPQTLQDGRQLHCYEKLVATRDFDGCYDYAVGFLAMYVHTTLPYCGETTRYETQLCMGSIDDSYWRACSAQTDSLEKANELTDKVYEFLKSSYGGALFCTEEQLNAELRKFGMYGQRE